MEPWIDIPAPSSTSTDCGGRPLDPKPVAWSRRCRPRADLLQVRRTSPAGSHKPNTAVAQAYYNKEAGTSRLVTRPAPASGARRSHLAGQLFGLDVLVYMVKASYRSRTGGCSWRRWGPRSSPHRRTPRTRDGRSWLRTRLDGVAGHGHQRGGRGRRDERRREVLAGVGARPRPAAPDRDRPGGQGADGHGRRRAGRDHRVRRRRVELRGPCVPVHGRQAGRDVERAVRGDRAGRLPHADQGHVRLRLRRHRWDGPVVPMYTLGHVRARAGAREDCGTTATRHR